MRVEQQPVFVLHQRPYRETSLLLELLSADHGRVGAIARGVRQPKPRIHAGDLTPFVEAHASWIARGELVTLSAIEPAGPVRALAGPALLAGLYVNELLVRLTARGDPHPDLFARFRELLTEITAPVEAPSPMALAWALRRFERDFLGSLGYAIECRSVVDDGTPIDPDADYSYDPDEGPRPWHRRPLSPKVSGRALLALASDDAPTAAEARELRALMRGVIRHLLGGRELVAWGMARAAARGAPPGLDASPGSRPVSAPDRRDTDTTAASTIPTNAASRNRSG